VTRAGARAEPTRQTAGLVAMVLATALWGGTFVILRDSLVSLSPAPLVCVRFACAALLLGAIAAARRARFDRAALRGGIFGGLAAAAGYACQATGLRTTSAGTSAFLTSAGTVFAGLLAWPLLGQRPTRELIAGIVLVVLGTALLANPGASGLGRGEAWTMAGSLAFALQVVVLARHAAAADPLALTTVQCATLALGIAPFAVASGAPAWAAFATATPATLARLAYLLCAGSIAAPLLQVAAQRVLPAGRVGLLFGLEPVFALVFAATLGGERFAPIWWLGAGAVLLGIAAVEVPAARRG